MCSRTLSLSKRFTGISSSKFVANNKEIICERVAAGRDTYNFALALYTLNVRVIDLAAHFLEPEKSHDVYHVIHWEVA